MAIEYATDETMEEYIREEFVILDFYSETCVPCKLFAKVLEDIEGELPFVKIVKVNTTQYPALGEKYGIRAVPTVLFYKDGQEKEKHLGMMSADQVKEIIGKYLY